MKNTGIKLNYQDYTICNQKQYTREIIIAHVQIFVFKEEEGKNQERNEVSPIRTHNIYSINPAL